MTEVRFAYRAGLAILLTYQLSICFGKEAPAPADPNRFLNAVIEFADNVLKYGRDTYGPKHTPLFVDGLNIHTHEPVKWIAPNGNRWILSNLASQQNLFRTLDGLTRITGDPKYKQAAMDAIKYAFDNLRSPNGLLYWGGHAAYDAGADKPCGRKIHELKETYPYYELMWEVNPQVTKQFIEAFWSGHILDWSNLDINRHCYYFNEPLNKPWDYEYSGGTVFFVGKGVSFIDCGSDLFYAATILSLLSNNRQPLIWAQRLAHRYVETRDPKIGIAGYVYTRDSSNPSLSLANDFKGHQAHPGTIFPFVPSIGNPRVRQAMLGQIITEPGEVGDIFIIPWMCQFLLADMLGNEGEEFARGALEELTAWGRYAYRSQENAWIPMLTDGTSLEGYVCKENMGYGPEGTVFTLIPVVPMDFWAYALAYRVTKDGFVWEMVRNIAQGMSLGDIGVALDVNPRLKENSDCTNSYILLGFLELYESTKNKEFPLAAKTIGDNILNHHFYKNFFLPAKDFTYAKFDNLDSLALLHLSAALDKKQSLVPTAWPSRRTFQCYYRGKELGIDNIEIYGLVGLLETPISIQEAVVNGDIELVSTLIERGDSVYWNGEGFLRTALHYAAIAGRKDIASLLLDNGSDPNAVDSYIATPLHYAAEGGHKEIVELLVAAGSDVSAENSYGDTPLQYAAFAGNKEIIELLLQKGATIANLHIASYMGDLEKAEAFIDRGVDINAIDGHGYAPLHYAAANNQKQIAELLIYEGADVNIKRWAGKSGEAPFGIAVSRGYKDIAEFLIGKGADINAADNIGNTPLHRAVQSGQKDIIVLLIEKGADINAKDNYGQTVLYIAVNSKYIDIAKLLIAKGADVNSADNKGNTPLHIAVRKNQADIAELLIEKGADINAKNNNGQVALYIAVNSKYIDIAKLLIAKGADVNSADNKGNTPLHIAVRKNQADIAELLIEKGANVNSKNNSGRAPIKIAFKRGRPRIMVLLENKGAEVPLVFIAAAMGDLARVQTFLKEGVDVNVKGRLGQTALHIAASEGHKQIVEFLLENGARVNEGMDLNKTVAELAMEGGHSDIVELLIANGADVIPLHLAISMKDEKKVRNLIESGADVNKRTPYGTTPLHRAVKAGFSDIARLLLDGGADVNAKDNWDWTPLHGAAEEGYKDMVELLIAKGANINPEDRDDRTPLWYAKKEGHTEIVELLKKYGAKKHAGKDKKPESAPAPKKDKEVESNIPELNDYDAGDLSSKEIQGKIKLVRYNFVIGMLA